MTHTCWVLPSDIYSNVRRPGKSTKAAFPVLPMALPPFRPTTALFQWYTSRETRCDLCFSITHIVQYRREHRQSEVRGTLKWISYKKHGAIFVSSRDQGHCWGAVVITASSLLGAWLSSPPPSLGGLGALSLASSPLGWSRGSRHRCATLVLGAIIIGPGARAWLFRVGIATGSMIKIKTHRVDDRTKAQEEWCQTHHILLRANALYANYSASPKQ